MSTYTCPHCGEHGLSTQKRHWCPKAPKISEVLRLGPPRSRDPIANEFIARLTRELEEARERERAVRDEATEYLAEVADTLADMHYGEECSFEGGDGCLACYAQDRIAEMQDALAAHTTDRSESDE